VTVAELRIESLRGEQIASQRDALAALRIEVFRDWPYLYEGSLDYEMRYLDTYMRAPNSLVLLVWDGAQCVGASTTVPLAEADPAMQLPFKLSRLPLDRIAYFGESLILRSHRGRGLGVKFFELREAHARELGLDRCAFCAVDRPADHPLRPADYVPNDAFWSRRGYRRVPELCASYRWTDIGEAESSEKPMTFWMRSL
jgi:GNAT superfamily N-acetyltransferase